MKIILSYKSCRDYYFNNVFLTLENEQRKIEDFL